MKFKCVTRWIDDEGSTFERAHERDAIGVSDAIDQERVHNARRFHQDGMGAEGWTWEILSVEPAEG